MNDPKLEIKRTLDTQKKVMDAIQKASDEIRKDSEAATQSETVQSSPSVSQLQNK